MAPRLSPLGTPSSAQWYAPYSILLGLLSLLTRAVQEDPNFHKYLRSEVANTASDAVLGEPDTAAQFQITGGQLVQMVPDGSKLYAVVEARANSTVMKLKMSWSDEPASGDNAGTFQWSGDTVEWSIPTIQRPQLNVSLLA